MKKEFLAKQINLIEKKIKALKAEVEHFNNQRRKQKSYLDSLLKELEFEKDKIKENPELSFSFNAFYEANKDKQLETLKKILVLDQRIVELKEVLVKQNIEKKKFEKLDLLEKEREKKIEEKIEIMELDEFALRKQRASGE